MCHSEDQTLGILTPFLNQAGMKRRVKVTSVKYVEILTEDRLALCKDIDRKCGLKLTV